MRREKHYVVWMAIEMRSTWVNEDRKPKRRWLGRVCDDIKENGMLWRKCMTMLHGSIYDILNVCLLNVYLEDNIV